MKKIFKKYLWLVLIISLSLLVACNSDSNNISSEPNIEIDTNIESKNIESENLEASLDEDGIYYKKSDVFEYLKTYNKLPKNYITKAEAKKLGWIPEEGNLQEVFENGVIGGDFFGNREGLLPKGKKYFECDVNYTGGRRGSERLVYTLDGDIYYTADHYKSFEELK
ncbi:MAG: ribonuclease domain-containing protein [Tissierellia bacterium]|nr:ribonuclease domain-containing protein [Tissierellia bacterium]